ncbi:MAG: pancreas/duodenum homeobox protein 1 [Desulfocapsaceae bacterium]
MDQYDALFSDETCAELMPAETADQFFEALFGDAAEGSFDLELKYRGSDSGSLRFDILLHERPGHCLACNLTYGLPEVFSRHPVININGIAEKVNEIIGDRGEAGSWKLGATAQQSQSLHAIPLLIELK